MWIVYAYGVSLVVAVSLAATAGVVRNDWRTIRCGAALLLNWAVGYAISEYQTDAWHWNILIDSLAALVILYRPAGRWQGVLGMSYVVQILLHISYGFRKYFGGGADAWEYYIWITVVAFLQLLILGGWSIGGLWSWSTHSRRDNRSGSSAQARDSGMAEP